MLPALARLGRPKFLVGGLLGGALGTAIAAFELGAVDWSAFALAQLTVSSFHLMTHYANDYFDQAADALAVRTPFSGGSGVLASGALAPRVALHAAQACAALGIVGTLALTHGHAVAATAAAAMGLLAWWYSAPPVRLLARSLGEIDAALVVAVLVPVCAYAAQTGRVDALVLASTLPGAGAMLAMMLAVEYPDVEADIASGKRNLVVRAGRARAAWLVGWAVAASFAGVGVAVAAGAPVTVAAFALLGVPAVVGLTGSLRRRAWESPGGVAGIAARGVALFVTVSLGMLCGYAVALP